MNNVKGWVQPHLARKYHWFGADDRSLCGRWAWWGQGQDDTKVGESPGPDDCVVCWKRAPRPAQRKENA